jgi:hypothetical protein
VGDFCPTRLKIATIGYMMGLSSYAFTHQYLASLSSLPLPPRSRMDAAIWKAVHQHPHRPSRALANSINILRDEDGNGSQDGQGSSTMEDTDDHDVYLRSALDGDEILARANATSGVIAVTARRLLVALPHRLALNVPISNVRRIQFDIEAGRPAAIAIVPDSPKDEPVLLTIPPEEYEAVSEALVIVGRELQKVSST